MKDVVAAAAAEVGTFLQLGGLAELPVSAIVAQSARRVLLLDPDETAAEGLRRKLPADLQGSVHAMMLGATSGMAELYQTNFPALNGLRAPAEPLFSLFPGLKVLGRKSVACVAIETFLESQKPLPPPLQLRLRCPGSERDVLEALKRVGLLHSVESLDIRCFSVAAFEGGTNCDALLAWLVEEGFALHERNDSDPDQPILLLTPDRHAKMRADMQNQLNTMRKTLTEREKHIAELQEKVAAGETERADLASKYEELSKSAARDKARFDELEAVRISEGRITEGRIAELEAETTALTATCDEARTELQRYKEDAATKQKRIAELEAEHVSLAKERGDLRVMLKGREEDLEKLRAQQQQDSALALRMMMLRDADLRDLRQRYAAIKVERNEAEELLQTLTVRLTEAARYLQQLDTLVAAAPGTQADLLPAAAKNAAKLAHKKISKKKESSSGRQHNDPE